MKTPGRRALRDPLADPPMCAHCAPSPRAHHCECSQRFIPVALARRHRHHSASILRGFSNVRGYPGSCGTSALLALAWMAAFTAATASLGVRAAPPAAASPAADASSTSRDANTVRLSDSQLHSIAVGRVEERQFHVQKEAVGSIDFDENSTRPSVLALPGPHHPCIPGCGRCGEGQILFTSRARISRRSNRASSRRPRPRLRTEQRAPRAKKLARTRPSTKMSTSQATPTSKPRRGPRAARAGHAIFGSRPSRWSGSSERRSIRAHRKSPIDGTIATRNAAPGLFVQPGNAPAPIPSPTNPKCG